MVSAPDVKKAAQRQEEYVTARHGYKTVTSADFEAKKEASLSS